MKMQSDDTRVNIIKNFIKENLPEYYDQVSETFEEIDKLEDVLVNMVADSSTICAVLVRRVTVLETVIEAILKENDKFKMGVTYDA